MWIAAVLLVAAVPVAVWNRPGASSFGTVGTGDQQVSYRLSQQLPDRLVLLFDDEQGLAKGLWRSTGRGIAVLPQQVRRAASLSESALLTGAIRPVAGAWQAFWRVLPGESVRVEPVERKTGLMGSLSEVVWA